ncbi:hypothetical protein TWF730_000765 [Orbilia blumenaviensis]|uniref:CENP-C homolog n=1 Tax=Orbilia blumenaviensis TaxID=1796055 RepID=A0AAV9VTS0_9PEZI
MAPTAVPKNRENIHTDIGFVGRKTGFTVQTGLSRDNDGMENMSAFFSPTSNAGTLPNFDEDDINSLGGISDEDHEDPESEIDVPSDPRARNVPAHDGSASMDIEDSTARSLTAILESRKGINTPARRKSMHSAHATPNLPLSNVTPQSNLSTPAMRRPHTKGASKPPPSRLSKPIEQEEESRDSFGSHKENVPNSIDSRNSDDAPVEAPIPRSIPLGARASGLRATGGRGSSMLVTKGLKSTRTAITPPPLSDDDDDDELIPFNEEPTMDDSEIDDLPAPPPKPKPTQRPAPAKSGLTGPTVSAEPSQKPKPSKKGKANMSNATDEPEDIPVRKTSNSDKTAVQKRGRKPKAVTEDVSEPEAPLEDEFDIVDAGALGTEPEEMEVDTRAEPRKKNNGSKEKKRQSANDTETELEPRPQPSNAGQKKKGGRPKKAVEPEPEPEEEPEPEPEPEPIVQKAKGRRKKSDNKDAPAPNHVAEPEEEEPAESSQPERKRGRKRKAETIIPNAEPEVAESSAAAESTGPSASKKRKGPKPTTTKAVVEKPKSSKPETSTTAAAAGSRRPARNRTAPLQFWKNEKQVYKVVERDESGKAVSVATDVLRVEEEPVAQKKKARPWRPVVVTGTEKAGKRTTRKKGARKAAAEESSSESDGDNSEDDWEQVGKLVGMVKPWLSNNEDDAAEEEEVEDEIATSRHGIEFKPIFGSDYLFAKTLGKPFMGCGILELQTGASKKLKSSGKMQLVFFILKGKVEAEVNELGFRISHGGQFQVPRGNMYKISNPFKKTARIFFAQACVPDPEADAE